MTSEMQNPKIVDDTALAVSPVLVGRQAIFDRNLQVFAYELLHRSGQAHEASFEDGDEATAIVMSNAFVDLGLDVVTGGKPAFVNLTTQLLCDELAHLFSPDRIVVEVLEDVKASDEVVARVKTLKDAGYTVALDDFVFHEHLIPLIELADIIKIDIFELGLERVEEQLELLSPYSLKFLAEKVETHEEFHACKDMGFDFFQGYFLCRPQIVEASKQRQSGLGLLRLLACLNNPSTTAEDLEKVITKDAKLSYRLLSYMNSSAFALTGQVESIHHALILLGKKTVRTWANMVVLSSTKGKSTEILTTALMRARMCETMAKNLGQDCKGEFFTVGLFSVLDALLGMTMADIIKNLPLADTIVHALLKREGVMGSVLDVAIAYERSPQTDTSSSLMETAEIRKCYFDALAWVNQVMAGGGD